MPLKNHKLPASRKAGGGNFLHTILAVGLAGLLGWMLWSYRQPAGNPGKIAEQNKARQERDSKRHPGLTPLDLILVTNKTTAPQVKSPPAVANQELQNPARPVPLGQRITPLTNLTPAIPPLVATNAAKPSATNSPAGFPRPVKNVLEAQIALVWQGISPGSIDGALGSQTRAAITAFQLDQKLPPTGLLDALTRSNLMLEDEPFTTCTITSNDLARLQPVALTWLGKSRQTALDFENILELVSEKSFSHPALIRQLNPSVNWSNVVAGATLKVPNAAYPEDPPKAAFVVIHLSARTLDAYDAATNLICHFPCSIAKKVDKRPVGLLKVEVIVTDPNYTWDPAVFPESPESKTIDHKLIIPPGPNNPVGVAWIGLDRPGYGMHGTPRPEEVGRTESHGCFRLANWNARYLAHIVVIGTPVWVLE